jgi:transglutaminase-like putative cysteine protease
MNLQKAIALVLLVASSVLAAAVLQDPSFPAVLCVLGLVGLSRRVVWTIKPNRHVVISVVLMVLAIGFTLHYHWVVTSRAGVFQPTATDAWQTVTRFFLAAMVAVLYLGQRNTLPASFAFFQIALTIAAGQILLLDDRTALFRILEAASVAGAALYMVTYRSAVNPAAQQQIQPAGSTRNLALAAALALTLNSGWVLGSVLYQHQGTVNALGNWVWGESSGPAYLTGQVGEVGFSSSGRLSSLLTIMERPDSTPIVKITSDSSPGYLRASVFEAYRQPEWYDRSQREAAYPIAGPPVQGSRRRFQLSAADPGGLGSMTVQHKTDLGDVIFTRLGTAVIDVPAAMLLKADDGVLRIHNTREDLSYRIFFTTSEDRTPPDAAGLRRMLGIPPGLDPRVAELAGRIFAGCQTPSEKIDAVVRHFQTHYTYALGLEVPQNQDPLTYFLLEASTGYCEYFASGAAMLLRIVNVPTRYVTGLLVSEKDPLEDAWLGRNNNAHAWVEAWDEAQGYWKIVEATVNRDAGAGLGSGSGNATVRSAWQAYQEFLRATYAYGLLGPIAWAIQYHPVWAAVLSVLGAAGLTGLWVHVRRTRSIPADGQHPADPAYQTLWRLLATMDRRIRRAGLVRGPSETLLAFATRVEQGSPTDHRSLQAAQWYRQYSDLRYRPAITPEDLQSLRLAAREAGFRF